MTFLSFNFWPCVAIGLIAFHASPAHWRQRVLLGLSLAFYATWSAWDAVLLVTLVMGAHAAARSIAICPLERTKLHLAVTAVTGLVAVLVLLKCSPWIVDALNGLRAGEGERSIAALIAPLGLSYYLFKLIGYVLDVYWEQMPAQPDFAAVVLYASFFPQIVSGPIQRAGDFFGQLRSLDRPDPADVVVGLRRILFGLFKKVVIADQVVFMVARVHRNPAGFSALELWITAYCFALQLYADFSGLTDIAIGLGLLFGVRGPENFNLPYFAVNMQEFWRRWHMSLTSWLSDYLFLPLRMTLRGYGTVGLSAAIFLNMLAVGLWHGPTANYAAFGALNGLLMIVSALTLGKRNAMFRGHRRLSQVRRIAGPLLTFHIVVMALVFFRAETVGSSLTYFAHLVPLVREGVVRQTRLDWTLLGISRSRLLLVLTGMAAMEGVHWGSRQRPWVQWFTSTPRAVRWSVYYAAVVLVLLNARGTTGFIYAQF